MRDRNAQVIVTNWLKEVSPHIPVFGEEGARYTGPRPNIYWIVDPIDGTRFFEATRYEWCVAIALVIDGVPRVGIILQPGRGEFVVAIEGKGAKSRTKYGPWQTHERLSAVNPMLVVPTSKKVVCNKLYNAQMTALTDHFEDTHSLPSVAACFDIARGSSWGWISLFEPYEWDIAATYVLIRELGGITLCANGDSIPWGQDKMPQVVFAITTRERIATIAWILCETKHNMCV